MTEKEYKKELWIYGVLVVVGSVLTGATGIVGSYISNMNSALKVILFLAGLFLFLLATIKLAIALKLKPLQWLLAIVLIIFFYVGSVVYMTTRKPPPLPPSQYPAS